MQFPEGAKVALVNPGTNPELAFHEPLNIGFLAGYLEQHGYEVRIIDELAGQDVARAIDAFSPHLVGITGTTPVIPHAYQHAAYARKKGIPVVLGGVHSGVCTAEAMQHCDVVVKGEGEVALLEILQKGITPELRQSKLLQGTPIKDLDTIPFPARHLMDMDFYVRVKQRVEQTHLYFVDHQDRVAGVLSSRGCPYFCAFCHNNWRETPLRCMTPERTIDELEHLKRDFGVTAVFFMDDDLFANKPRIKRLCELMIERRLNLKWGCQARVKAKAVNEEMLRLAYRAGCRQMSFG
ncbi:MAG: cobalamin-dependent protein, partial [Myxococcales bacterium]|nr:cobalamin-dependent protein [Myxococcales bacterium]